MTRTLPQKARRFFLLLAVFAIALVFAGCDVFGGDDDDDDDNPPATAVFTMTNAAGGNEVIVYDRAEDGSLQRFATFPTGGQGSGPPEQFPLDPFGSQDSVILSEDGRILYVVNAGSNSISSFEVASDGTLSLMGTVDSGGTFPLSLTMHEDLLYVLNARGEGGNISGFTGAESGELTPLDGSTRPLSGVETPLPGNAVGPADVQFNPDGTLLAVTEKVTSLIDVYQVGADGTPGPPNTQPSPTPTPFGTEFADDGTYIVSETNATAPRMGVPGGSSVSSYTLSADGTLNTISGSVPTQETAACWIAITEDQQYVYDTNTASGTISGFNLGADGTLTPVTPSDGITADLGDDSVLLDIALADEYLYTIGVGSEEISGFQIEDDGSLTPLPDATVSGFPGASSEGLAAR